MVLVSVGNSRLHSERYNIRQGAWEPIHRMENERWGHELVAYDKHVYAIGGWNDDMEHLGIVERYDVSTDMWDPVKPMNQRRESLAATQLSVTMQRAEPEIEEAAGPSGNVLCNVLIR